MLKKNRLIGLLLVLALTVVSDLLAMIPGSDGGRGRGGRVLSPSSVSDDDELGGAVQRLDLLSGDVVVNFSAPGCDEGVTAEIVSSWTRELRDFATLIRKTLAEDHELQTRRQELSDELRIMREQANEQEKREQALGDVQRLTTVLVDVRNGLCLCEDRFAMIDLEYPAYRNKKLGIVADINGVLEYCERRLSSEAKYKQLRAVLEKVSQDIDELIMILTVSFQA